MPHTYHNLPRTFSATRVSGSAFAGRVSVRVRYRHAGAAAALEMLPDGNVLVHFDAPVRAVAPGQAAVFDVGDAVLGGGWLAA